MRRYGRDRGNRPPAVRSGDPGVERRQPLRRTHVVDHRKDLRVFLVVELAQLLAQRLGVTEVCADARGVHEWGDRGGELVGPDGGEVGCLACARAGDTVGYAAGVDEQVELLHADAGDPVGPVDVCSDAGVMNGARGDRVRGEGEAATA